MINIILSVIYIINYSNSSTIKEIVHPCERYIDHLSLDTKLKISIGCSKIKGNYLYDFKYLSDLTEGRYE